MRQIARLAAVLLLGYTGVLVLWQALRLVAGDRFWWLGLANSFSFYLFIPLLVLAALAGIGLVWLSGTRWPAAVLVASMGSLAIGLVLYGGLFLPDRAVAGAAKAVTIRALTFNVLGSNNEGAPVARTIRAESPDLVFLQELNPRMAADLSVQLQDDYPYHVLLPEEGVTGLGVFSRFPLADEGEIPDPAWEHGAQVMTMRLEGRTVLLLNVHALSSWTPFGPVAYTTEDFEESYRLRQTQVGLWLDRINEHDGPVIIAGDFNFTDQNAAYQQMAARLEDSHRQVGWGLGHTFPARVLHLGWIPIPTRLLRLDYVWHSPHWAATSSHVGEWDGRSDHLPFISDLLMTAE
jgi:endonuclease/exonuclease/phosphatase (EEP) superfamily protein YafD